MPRGIPDPKADVDALHKTVVALKEAVEVLTGVRRDANAAASEKSVSVADLAAAATFAELRDRLTGFQTPNEQNSHPDWSTASELSSAVAAEATARDAAIAAAIAALDLVSVSQTEFISGLIANAANGDYRLIVNIPHGATITEVTTRCTSGTATATFKINSTALGGTANSVSPTEQSQAHSSANVMAAGDDLVLTISAAAACLNMSFTVKYTKSLAYS
jgi:hypothetical protein